jgi:hypothetical protein
MASFASYRSFGIRQIRRLANLAAPRCDVDPPWRLMAQPMRSSSANACFAFVEDQFGEGILGGNEGNVHRAGHGLAGLKAICH